MDSFQEFEQATNPGSGVVQQPKPQAPRIQSPEMPREIPVDRVIPPNPNYPRKERPNAKRKVDFLFFAFLFVLVLMICLTAIFIERPELFGGSREQKRAARFSEILPSAMLKEKLKTAQSDVSRLSKRNLRANKKVKALQRETKRLRENLATKNEVIRRLQVGKSADEKYHRFLTHALDRFYTEPFKRNEKLRSICFTTDRSDRKCYQLERPYGWFEGDTIFPQPAKLRRL